MAGILNRALDLFGTKKHVFAADFSPYLVLEPEDFKLGAGRQDETARVLVERYRRLYVNLFKSAGTDSGISVGILSAVPREGKTTVLANMAMTMAMDLHKKILMVDANFEDPQLAQIFGDEGGPGIDEWLVGSVPFEAIIRPTAVENLKLLSLTRGVDNPLKWADSEAFQRLVARVSRDFDIVLWDTPALLTSSVGVSLAKKLRRAVIVTRMGYTRRAVVKEALELISDVPLLGVVPTFREYWIPSWIYNFL